MRSGNPVSHPPWIRKPQGSPPSSITRRLLSIRLLPSKYTDRIREGKRSKSSDPSNGRVDGIDDKHDISRREYTRRGRGSEYYGIINKTGAGPRISSRRWRKTWNASSWAHIYFIKEIFRKRKKINMSICRKSIAIGNGNWKTVCHKLYKEDDGLWSTTSNSWSRLLDLITFRLP